jgi:paraquat-inducible protein A
MTATALNSGLVACKTCTRVWPLGKKVCDRCGETLKSRDPHSLQRVWAWWLVGLMAYVPANTYPMLLTRQLTTTRESTIIGGAIELMRHGAPGIAIIILFASVVIPVGKFVAIAMLALAARNGSRVREGVRMRIYEVVEYVGRWSMIDVFVVAILAALVQLRTLASVQPGPASLFFAASVILTMLSARSFDSRLIWDMHDSDSKAAKA